MDLPFEGSGICNFETKFYTQKIFHITVSHRTVDWLSHPRVVSKLAQTFLRPPFLYKATEHE